MSTNLWASPSTHTSTQSHTQRPRSIVDYVCLGVFTVEFVGRTATCPSLWLFVRSPMNLVDFFAIAPFFVEVIMQARGAGSGGSQARILRLIRLLRVLRLLKLGNKWVLLCCVLLRYSSAFFGGGVKRVVTLLASGQQASE